MQHSAAAAQNSEPSPSNEEPEIVLEESVPSDGKDVEGEKLMEQIPPHQAPQPD